MNQRVLHSHDRSYCNHLKLTPPESLLMFIWKPFDLIEVLFSSVDRAINSCINIYFNRKMFSLYQLSSFLCFLQQMGCKRPSLCFFSFQIGGKRELPAILQTCNHFQGNGWAVSRFLVLLEVPVRWQARCSCRLYSSQQAHISKGPTLLPKTSYKIPATVSLQAEWEDCIGTHCIYLL